MSTIHNDKEENYMASVMSDLVHYLLDLPGNVQISTIKKPESDYDYYMLHGQLSCGRDLPAKALRSFQECLRLNPASFTACTALGLIHNGRGDYDQAVEFFEKAHAIERGDFKTMLRLLYLKLQLNEPENITAPLEHELLSPVRQYCVNQGINYDDFASEFSKCASLQNSHPDWGNAFTEDARSNFQADKFTVLRQILPYPLTEMLYSLYMNYLNNDQMVFQRKRQRFVKPEDPISTLVQYHLCEHVQKLTGTRVVPTYTIGLHYIKDGHIKPHLDRRQNELSMSLCIGAEPGEVTWPLYAKKGDEEVCDILQPNDAFLYRGNEIVHYRKPLPEGQTVTQLIIGFRSVNSDHCNCQ